MAPMSGISGWRLYGFGEVSETKISDGNLGLATMAHGIGTASTPVVIHTAVMAGATRMAAAG